MSNVNFDIVDNGSYYWIAVDREDLGVDNGHAEKELELKKHILSWYAAGPSGVAMTIVISQPGAPPLKFTCRIPAGEGHAAGKKPFMVVS